MAFDVIVIGSGFGGAITSCRLQEKGYKVLVLERGRRWDKTNFPRDPEDPWIWDSDKPEHCNGWLELRTFPHMSVAVGAAVGGGSLIYANISREAPRWRFEKGWPAEITYDELKPHYDTVKAFMNVREVPDNQWTSRMRLDERGCGEGRPRRQVQEARVGREFRRDVDLRQAGSRHRRERVEAEYARGRARHLRAPRQLRSIGCDVHAKNTLDRNYLFVAEQKCAHRSARADARHEHRAPDRRRIPRVVRSPGERRTRVGERDRESRHRGRRIARIDGALAPLPRRHGLAPESESLPRQGLEQQRRLLDPRALRHARLPAHGGPDDRKRHRSLRRRP